MRRFLCLAAAIAAAFFVSDPAAAQDAARGRQLAGHACINCHGENGRSQMEGIPSLAGQPTDFIVTQMILFREGIRQVPAMQAFAANLPDQDIIDLAAFFAALPPGPPDDRRPRDAALFAAGAALSGPRRCATCHVGDYGGRAQIPRISAQREEYLVHALKGYRDGTRAGADAQMNGAVVGLSDPDLLALAHYLSQLD
jgi:cytochrome c553